MILLLTFWVFFLCILLRKMFSKSLFLKSESGNLKIRQSKYVGSGGLWFQGFNRRTSGQCLEMSIYFSNFGTNRPDFPMLILCCQHGCGWTPLPSLFSSLMDNGVQTPAGSLQLPQAALQELALGFNSRTLTQQQSMPWACSHQ